MKTKSFNPATATSKKAKANTEATATKKVKTSTKVKEEPKTENKPLKKKKKLSSSTATVPSVNLDNLKGKTTSKVTKEEPKKDAKVSKPVKATKEPKEQKYLYPADCKDPMTKKKFRHDARAKVKSFEKQLGAIKDKKGKEYLKIEKEYKAFQKETFGK